MTAGELIIELQKYDPSTEVFFNGMEIQRIRYKGGVLAIEVSSEDLDPPLA